MFGKKKDHGGAIPHFGEPRPYWQVPSSPSYNICQICGKKYSTVDSARTCNACDTCYHDYLRDRISVPETLKPIARSYQYDFDCYAKYQAILTIFSHRVITLEERQRMITNLVKEYEEKQKQTDAQNQAYRQKEAEQRVENAKRLRDMYKI